MVIGFNGSGLNQYASAYAVMGTTTKGVTTFTSPILLKQGTGDWNPTTLPSSIPAVLTNTWGNYSETTVDGDSPNSAFWTFQEYAVGPNEWAVQFFKIAFPQPSAGPNTLGILGDDISFDSGTGVGQGTGTVSEAPNWVAQTSNNGDFTVGATDNEALLNARSSSLAAQTPLLESQSPYPNYTVVMIGEYDALDLVEGVDSPSTFLNNTIGPIETALQSLMTNANSSGTHIILATIPDIFVTPEVQGMNLTPAQTSADEALVEEANEAIQQYALANGVTVIDLYSTYQEIAELGTLNVAGVTYNYPADFFASGGFDPSPILEGIIGNEAILAANLATNADLTPISDQQLDTNDGKTPTVLFTTDFTYEMFEGFVYTSPAPAPTVSISAVPIAGPIMIARFTVRPVSACAS